MFNFRNSISLTLQPRSLGTEIIKRLIMKDVTVPKPVPGKSYRRIVHYEDKYTVKPLNVTNLAGRDPVTGRVVCNKLGGGIKHKYHWIDWKRDGPEKGHICEEVIEIIVDGCRTAHVALVAVGDKLKYILATENMKPGNILKTSREIPRIPVRANEGDAYPLGALPVGTQVHCVEKRPNDTFHYVHAAGTFATITQNLGSRVVIKLPSKIEVALQRECMATVGRLSNVLHGQTHVGSANANRALGNRPKSGLFQKKDGRFGRKIKKLPPVKFIEEKPRKPEKLTLSWDLRYMAPNEL